MVYKVCIFQSLFHYDVVAMCKYHTMESYVNIPGIDQILDSIINI